MQVSAPSTWRHCFPRADAKDLCNKKRKLEFVGWIHCCTKFTFLYNTYRTHFQTDQFAVGKENQQLTGEPCTNKTNDSAFVEQAASVTHTCPILFCYTWMPRVYTTRDAHTSPVSVSTHFTFTPLTLRNVALHGKNTHTHWSMIQVSNFVFNK